jgi:hypothetical protein
MTWILGNTTVPFVNENGGYIPASEFNNNGAYEAAPMNVPWYYDPTSPSYGTVGCATNPFGITCISYDFNQGGVIVGNGQRLVPGKYTLYMAVKSTGAASTFQLQVGVCAPGDTAVFTVPVTSTYVVQQFQVDLTGKTCGGSIAFSYGFSNVADTISVGYAAMAPLPQQFNAYGINITNNLLLNGVAGTTGQVPTVQSGGALGWGSGGGFTTLTNDVTASGTGTVAATVTGLNGVQLSTINGLLQDTSGAISKATQVAVTGPVAAGTILSSGINSVAASATPNFDLSLGNNIQFTLSANVTSSTVSNWTSGAAPYFFTICNPSGYAFPTPTWALGWLPVSTTGCSTQALWPQSSGTLASDGYNSAFCALSGSGPLACGNAYKGFITIPAGTNPTQQINTTALGPNSIILFTPDSTIGASVTPAASCNATVPTELVVSARGTGNFTVEAIGTFTTNPVCLTYVVVNP